MSDNLKMARTYEAAVAHLTSEQLKELISDYYAGKQIDGLLRDYQIECPPNFVYKAFPPAIRVDRACPYCGKPMHESRASRTATAARYFRAAIICPECGHRDDRACECVNCSTARQREQRKAYLARYEMVKAFCLGFKSGIRADVATIGLAPREAVALLALTRACRYHDALDEEGNVIICNLVHATTPYAPGHELGWALISEMIASRLIRVSDLSPLDAFEFKNDRPTGYLPERVYWAVTVDNSLRLLEELEQLAARPDRWPENWLEELRNLWHIVALEECKEFFRYAANERGLPASGAMSTEAMLKNLLKDFSVSQCYRIIYAGAQYAADFFVRKNCSKSHAANYMIGACQRWADKARAEKWEVKHYRRRFDLPRSSLSYVLFDVFLGIGEEGFTRCPPSDVAMCNGDTRRLM